MATFYNAEGTAYITEDPVEITRLMSSRGHTTEKAEAVSAAPGTPHGGASFDPNEHTVEEVVNYLSARPDDYERVVEAERQGKNRKSITGDE